MTEGESNKRYAIKRVKESKGRFELKVEMKEVLQLAEALSA